MENDSRLHCAICQKKFSCTSARNQHMKNMHQQPVENTKYQHIKCPICPAERQSPFMNNNTMIQHLTELHNVNIKQSEFLFRNMEEFDEWRGQENRNLVYTYIRSIKRPNGQKHMFHDCNRSNSKGYKSNCSKRAMRAQGSIKISGVCPSRIHAKVLRNGVVSVCFVETHAGHNEEFRLKRLLKRKEAPIVEQLDAEVSSDKILQDVKETDASYQNELSQYLEMCENQQKKEKEIAFERRRKIEEKETSDFIRSLDRDSYTAFMEMVETFKDNLEHKQNENLSRMLKIEK